MTEISRDGINKAARTVVLRHPHSIDCVVFRKRMDIAETSSLGRFAVDTPEIDWEAIGDGKALFIEPPPAHTPEYRECATDGVLAEFHALIEPSVASGADGYFATRPSDVLLLLIAEEIKIAYEVVDVIEREADQQSFVLAQRDDLTTLPT